MSTVTKAKNIEGSTKTFELDRLPDRCPICHHSVEPEQAGPAHLKSSPKRIEIPVSLPTQGMSAADDARLVPYFYRLASTLMTNRFNVDNCPSREKLLNHR